MSFSPLLLSQQQQQHIFCGGYADIATGGDGGGVTVVAATVVQAGGSDGDDPDEVQLKIAGMSRRRRFTTRAHVRVITDDDFETWAEWQQARDVDARAFGAAVRRAKTFEEAERVVAVAAAALEHARRARLRRCC